ncbi:ABC transporter substrate-binding protein [Paracoccus sediminicola]|uniref:ABC transporter substrate-binding protein n=1 Tax=Paracoccus sediminicola TaxID=3017783 RepID=UPI0022F006C9|nr:ABC transporter substrate-binding protein [Paracoccus sediminicola]WBU56620.1 ABC transporter substrate-binding protein [Paracoccus sediminicola]
MKTLLCGTALTFAAAAATAEPVKIGVLEDMSGIYADLSGEGSVYAAQMAVEDFGKDLLGEPIELVSADHQNKADVASSLAREWLDNESVDAIFGLGNSAAALAVQELAKERGKFTAVSTGGSTALTGEACSPTGMHWTYDTRALAVGTGAAAVDEGLDTWYFLTADYAFGQSLEENTTAVVTDKGGEVLGNIRHPLGTNDFSSYLLQAQASGAKVIGLASAGGDMNNAVNQAAEFGITSAGQSLAGLLMFITDVHAITPEKAQGMILTTGYYWDRDDASREWAARFEEEIGRKPTMAQVGVYSSVLHFLKAVEAAGSLEPEAVMEAARSMPVEDVLTQNGTLREDGRMVYDMYLARVKSPDQVEGPWDYYEILRTIPGDEVFLPIEESTCPQLGQ